MLGQEGGPRHKRAALAAALLLLLASLAVVGFTFPRGPFPPPGPDPTHGPTPSPTPKPTPNPAPAPPLDDLVSHNRTGRVPVPGEMANLSARPRGVGHTGFEPTLGVTKSGAIFVTGGSAAVWVSRDQGEHWDDAIKRTLGLGLDFDPYLWVDPATNRILSLPNAGGCSDVHWSDDEGRSWQPSLPAPASEPLPNPGGCGWTGHDHQNLAGGPPVAAHPTQGYASALYYTYSKIPGRPDPEAGVWLTRSYDGGKTWEPQSKPLFSADCQAGMSGAPAVAPDGTVYVAKPGCDGLVVAASRDGGDTWTQATLGAGRPGMGGGTPTAGGPTSSSNPGVAVDSAGNAYAVWAGKDGLLYVSHSSPHGWSPPLRATPPGITVTAFSAVAAGQPGRIVLAYVATTEPWASEPYEAHFALDSTPWHLYETWSLDALDADPVFTTLRLTPGDDPVHVGPINQAGKGVTPSSNRQLGDFLSLVQWNGKPYVAYADSCDLCAGKPAPQANLWVAMVADGAPSLGPS